MTMRLPLQESGTPRFRARWALPQGRHRALQVAIVGADGAGKSTVTQRLETAPLPAPVKRIYMGVNLEASSLMLPTTRLLLAVKRSRGGRPDLVANTARPGAAGLQDTRRQGWRRDAKDATRLAVWIVEEWLRQLVATIYGRRGYLVVFDRHFFADYYHTDIEGAGDSSSRSAPNTLHGWMLKHAYPKPDLVICLDAPGDVLFARKPESSAEWLEARRQQYLRLADVVPAFELVNVDRPFDEVLNDVVAIIGRHWKAATP